ncbi:MAG: thioredoxin family protein [Planctomycetaceae bacterium]
MVKTASTMLPLGTAAPDFSLPNVDGRIVSLKEFKGSKGLVVAFICNHCPFVVHIRSEFAKFAREYQAKGIAVVAINPNDAKAYPADAPDKMKAEVELAGYSFAYLFDESQSVAKAYRAACTPDLFLFDGSLRLAYRGQFDDSRPTNGVPVTGSHLRAACDSVLAGKVIEEGQRPSIGCNIKWRPGNEPNYFTGQPAE